MVVAFNASPVMRISGRLYAAVRWRCAHGMLGVECLACLRRGKIARGEIEELEIKGEYVEPSFGAWGSSSLNDIFTEDGYRHSSILRRAVNELGELDNVVIDFWSSDSDQVWVQKSKVNGQVWIRLPKGERELESLPVQIRALEEIRHQGYLTGKKWKRTRKWKLEDLVGAEA